MTYNNISFLSDYGQSDEFVGVVHSVIKSIAPSVSIIDIAHSVPQFDIRAGSLALVRSVQYLNPGVVLAVVDPSVGTARRAVAVEVGENGEAVFVGPDNGLLAPAVAMVGGARRAVELNNTKLHLAASGPTFAGRDIFAPAAAHLCAGLAFEELGDEIDPITLLPGVLPLPQFEGEEVKAEVLWVDRFGNIQLNVGAEDVPMLPMEIGEKISVQYGTDKPRTRTARRVIAYDDLGAGEVGLLVDSYGLLSLVMARASSAEALVLGPGSGVTLIAAK